MTQPHSLGHVTIVTPIDGRTPAQEYAARGWAARHGYHWPKGTVLPETDVPACPRVKVADLPKRHLNQKHIEHMEQNQKIASCCRHPENHEVEARKSHPEEPAPDKYIYHCKCGRKHRFFCLGFGDPRPIWDAS